MFQGNRTCLRLKGFIQGLDDSWIPRYDWTPDRTLPGVTHLILTKEEKPENTFLSWNNSFSKLGAFFPNVCHLDISYSKCIDMYDVKPVFSDLISLSAQEREFSILKSGYARECGSLREVYLRGIKDNSMCCNVALKYSLPPNLERLDIRGAWWGDLLSNGLPEEEVVELIRSKPTLQWVGCDLSDEARLMLLAERPNLVIINWRKLNNLRNDRFCWHTV